MKYKFTTDYIGNHQDGLKLITAFKRNIYVHKSHTGMGGTTVFLNCDKNVIILSPNTGMVSAKSQSDPNKAIYIYGGAKGKWSAAITNARRGYPTKVNATWASLQILKEKKQDTYLQLKELFHLVIDEVHCIYDDLREGEKDDSSISSIIHDWKLPWVVTTATPMQFDVFYDNAEDVVFFQSIKPREHLTVYVPEDHTTDLSELLQMQFVNENMIVSSNDSKYATLYPSKHQILASEKFKVKANIKNAVQIKDLQEVDDSCDYVQITTRYNTGFDIHGDWHSVVVAEYDQRRKVNVDAKTHQQVRQSLGRLRDTPLSNVVLWRSFGSYRKLSEIREDIGKEGPTQKLLQEYALTETYVDLNRFILIMEGYGYDVELVQIANHNNIRRLSLLQQVNHVIGNGDVHNSLEKAFKYVKGDNQDNVGLNPTIIIAHIIAVLIIDEVITIESVSQLSSQPGRVYDRLVDVLKDREKYLREYDFIKIHVFNNRISRSLASIEGVDMATISSTIAVKEKAFGLALNRLEAKVLNIDHSQPVPLHLKVSDVTRNLYSVTCKGFDDEFELCLLKRVCDKIKEKVDKAIRKNKRIDELMFELMYSEASVMNKWKACNWFLFCKKHELPTTFFKVSWKRNREYNPLTKSEKITRYLLPLTVYEFDIKEAYPSFIDVLLDSKVSKDIYYSISQSREIKEEEAKIYYNRLINNHYAPRHQIKDELESLGYNQYQSLWLSDRISRNEMYDILTEIEKQFVSEFRSYFGAPSVRLHDAVITFVPPDRRIKEYFLEKGILFKGGFVEGGQITIPDSVKSISELLHEGVLSVKFINMKKPSTYRYYRKEEIRWFNSDYGCGPHLDRLRFYPRIG